MQGLARILGSALLLVTLAPHAAASTWKIDPAHSAATFKVKHLLVSTVTGKMSGLEGTLELDDKDVTKSKVTAKLDAKTINTNETKRDEHLRSPDFFDTGKFPDVKFESKSVKDLGGGKLEVLGALTMHGVTKDVTLTVTELTPPAKGMKGDNIRGLNATATVNRKDFGVSWNKALDGGGLAVGEDIVIDINAELSDNTKATH